MMKNRLTEMIEQRMIGQRMIGQRMIVKMIGQRMILNDRTENDMTIGHRMIAIMIGKRMIYIAMMIRNILIEMNEINDEMIIAMMNCENNKWRMTTRTNSRSTRPCPLNNGLIT